MASDLNFVTFVADQLYSACETSLNVGRQNHAANIQGGCLIGAGFWFLGTG